MKQVNFNDVVFDQPVTIIATNSNGYSNVAVEEFRSTKGISVERFDGFNFDINLGAAYKNADIERAFVKYVSLKAETAKIECSIKEIDKKIMLINYTDEVLDELNRQEVPYYRPAIEDAEDDDEYNVEDRQFETQIISYDYTTPYIHDLILIGLRNAGITKFHATDERLGKLFSQVEKEFNRQVHRSDGMDVVYFIDSYGHLVSRTINPISMEKLYKCFNRARIGMHIATGLGCVHSSYMPDNDVVVFARKDAQAIIKAVDEYLMKENMTDVDLFGDSDISYERLYDVVNGLIYPLVGKDVPICYWSYRESFG